MDEAIVAQTQEIFGALIKKPKMTAKLLNKPPFRFLHDVFSETSKATGFAEGLYEGDELQAGSIKDKESKIAYLQKMLDYTQAACGREIDVKLSKVVAGLEAENTNTFLQAMGSCAADPNVDRARALQTALGLPAGDDGADAAADEEAARQAAEEQQRAEQARHEEEQQRALLQQQQQEEEQARMQQQMEQEGGDDDQGGDDDDQAQQEAMMQQQMMQQQQDEERSRLAYEQQQEERARMEQEELLRQQAEAQAPPAPSNNSRPPSHQGNSRPPSNQGQQEYTGGEMGEPSNEMIPPAMRKALPARPTTARRAPPKLPTKEVKVNRGPTPVQQNPDEPPTSIAVGLITEQESDEEDDDADVAADMLSAPIPGFDDIDVDVDEDGMHGKLVGDILAEKKQMNAAAEETQEEAPEESQGIVIKKRRSSVESTAKKNGVAAPQKKQQNGENTVQSLREEIQKLVKATNPLGKCIEYIQEDLENMEKEYRMWKTDASSYGNKLDAQSNNTESSLVPLQQELIEHTEKSENLTAQINRVKASILHNDMTIHNLLRGVVGTGMK